MTSYSEPRCRGQPPKPPRPAHEPPPAGSCHPALPVPSPGKEPCIPSQAQPPAQARQPKYLQEALPFMGTATIRRVHMPQQCLIKLPNSQGIPLRLSEDKLETRPLSGNIGTGKEQLHFFTSTIMQIKPRSGSRRSLELGSFHTTCVLTGSPSAELKQVGEPKQAPQDASLSQATAVSPLPPAQPQSGHNVSLGSGKAQQYST